MVKSSLGLRKYFNSTPLLYKLCLYQKLMLYSSLNRCNCLIQLWVALPEPKKKNYCHVLMNFLCTSPQSTVIHRVIVICHRNDTSIVKVIFWLKNYVKNECKQLKKKDFVNDGLVDSCRQLLNQYDGYNKYMLELLLTPF